MKSASFSVPAVFMGMCAVGAFFALSESSPGQTTEERLEALEKKWDEQFGEKSNTFRVYWKDSLRFETANKNFTMRVGGRVHNDWTFVDEDEDVEAALGEAQDDSVKFRRARLYLSGTLYKNIEFKWQYDFAGGATALKDAYLAFTQVPVVSTLYAGQFKEPIALEQVTSSNDISFIERSVMLAFNPERSTGFMVGGPASGERVTWNLGVFKDSDDKKGGDIAADGDFAYTGRVTGLPVYDKEHDQLVHVGGSYSYRMPNDEMVQFKSNPEASTDDPFVDTGAISDVDEYSLAGLEVAGMVGPFSAQAEYMMADLNVDTGSDPSFDAWYSQVGYLITGESRQYKTTVGAFENPRPRSNFRSSEGCGWGAWEALVRYSSIDLDDEAVAGGEMDDLSFGLNWYLNPNTRVMWNLIFSDLEDVGDTQILSMRLQVYF